MRAYTAYRIDPALLDIWQGSYPKDRWSDDAYGLITQIVGNDALVVIDLDGSTQGDATGINVLFPRKHLAAVVMALEASGFEVEETEESPEPGHYGDGQYEGAELMMDSGDQFWLIPLCS